MRPVNVRSAHRLYLQGRSTYALSRILTVSPEVITDLISEMIEFGDVHCASWTGRSNEVVETPIEKKDEASIKRIPGHSLGKHTSYMEGIKEDELLLNPEYLYEKLSQSERYFYENNKLEDLD